MLHPVLHTRLQPDHVHRVRRNALRPVRRKTSALVDSDYLHTLPEGGPSKMKGNEYLAIEVINTKDLLPIDIKPGIGRCIKSVTARQTGAAPERQFTAFESREVGAGVALKNLIGLFCIRSLQEISEASRVLLRSSLSCARLSDTDSHV